MRKEVIGDATLYLGDCRDVLKTVAEASVDSIVCDQPYHLTSGKKGGTGEASVNLESPYGRARVTTGFMGMTWDGGDVAQDPAMWAEALRVLKPGGHMVAFSGTRTYHRMVCAIEDAGFEIRDQLAWVYGSGFPKSHNGEWGGTALKPAWEPIVLARKPLIGTVEANWLEHRTGALNIDGCRVQGEPVPAFSDKGERAQNVFAGGTLHGSNRTVEYSDAGRWPANLIHDGSDEVLAAFPDAPGQQSDLTGSEPSRPAKNVYGEYKGRREFEARGDAGSAARFFYCAKAGQEDRNEGLHGFAKQQQDAGRKEGLPGGDNPRNRGVHQRANHHPTVKPTDLMRWLVRLITPAGGLVLDPFMGSGSTGKAAVLEGLRFVGIDLTAEYLDIARARIEFARRQRASSRLFWRPPRPDAMHQASPPLADLSAAGPHSPSPQHAREAGSGGEGSFQRSTSDNSDMTDTERETEIELYELREIWFDAEGLHSKAEEARAMQLHLIQGRKHVRSQE